MECRNLGAAWQQRGCLRQPDPFSFTHRCVRYHALAVDVYVCPVQCG